MNLRESLSYFQLELLKNQLEQSLELTGSSSKDSVKLILQYSSQLAQLSKQQRDSENYEVASQLLLEAYQILLPSEPPRALTQQFQYWRLLFNISVEIYLVLYKQQRQQQGLNIMLTVYNLAKDKVFKGSIEQYCESDLLCFHISFAWDKQKNKEQAESMALEALLMISRTLAVLKKLKNKTTSQLNLMDKKIKMALSLNDLLNKYYQNDINKKFTFMKNCLLFSTEYLGQEHLVSLKYERKLNSIKAEMDFEICLDQIDYKDFQAVQKDQPKEIEFDIKDEDQDRNLLFYLDRPMTAQQRKGKVFSRGRRLHPASQTETRLSEIISKLNESKRSASFITNQNIIKQLPQKKRDNIYYLFSKYKTQTAETDSQVQQQQTTQHTNKHRILTESLQPELINNYTSTPSIIIKQAQPFSKAKVQKTYDISDFKSVNFQTIEREQKLIKKDYMNALILQRPATAQNSQVKITGQVVGQLLKKFKQIHTQNKSPQNSTPQDGSNSKLQRIKDFDIQRKNIMIISQKSKKASRDLFIQSQYMRQSTDRNANSVQKSTQEQQKISKSNSMLTFDKKSEIQIPIFDTTNIELESAVTRIQRFYRQKRDAVVLIHQNKTNAYLRQKSQVESFKRSSIGSLSSESDSLVDILEQDEEQEKSPKKGLFKRSVTMLNEGDYNFKKTDSLQKILSQKVPNIQLQSEKFRLQQQYGRNSVKLIILSAKNQPLSSQILLSSQRKSGVKEECEESFQQPSQIPKLGAPQNTQELQINDKNMMVKSQIELDIMQKLIDRQQLIQLRYRELRAIQRAFHNQIQYIILNKYEFHVKQNQKSSPDSLSKSKLSGKFKKVKNTILFAVRSGGLKHKPQEDTESSPEQKQEIPISPIKIPLLDINHLITSPDVGAITLNKAQHHESHQKNQLSSTRDLYGQQIKKILHSGTGSRRMSSTLDQLMINTQTQNTQKVIIHNRKISQRDPQKVSFQEIETSGRFLDNKKEIQLSQIQLTKDESDPEQKMQFHKTYSIFTDSVVVQPNQNFRSSIQLENMEQNSFREKADKLKLFKSVQENAQKITEKPELRSRLSSEPQYPLYSVQSQKHSTMLISANLNFDTSVDKKRMRNTINSFQINSILSSNLIKSTSQNKIIQDNFRLLDHQFTINEEESARNKTEVSRRDSFFRPLKEFSEIEDKLQWQDDPMYQQNYFCVSPQWQKLRKIIKPKQKGIYFDSQVEPRYKNQYCYLNPFPNQSLIMCFFLKKDGTLFQISVTLQCLKEFEQLTTQITQSKDIKVQINFISFDRKQGNKSSKVKNNTLWEDVVIILFKDFIKWFAGDFKLHKFISKQGFTQTQKLDIIHNISENITIQDCKLKIEYYKDNGLKKAKRKYERKDLLQEYVMIQESYFKREEGLVNYQEQLDLFLNNSGKFLTPNYKTLQDQRIKLALTVKRKENRVNARIIKQQALTSTEEFTEQQKEIGPFIAIRPDDDFIHQVERDLGSGIPLLSYELSKDLLQGYNTLRIKKGNKYIVPFKSKNEHYSYLIWKSVYLQDIGQEILKVRIIHPFSKHSSDVFEVRKQNKEKLINLSQIQGQYRNKQAQSEITSLQNFILNINLKRILTLSGIQTLIVNKPQNYQNLTKIDQLILQHMKNYKNSSIDELQQLQSLIKISLLQTSKNDASIWNIYFKLTQRLMYGKLKNFGPCFLDISVYIDNFHFSLMKGLQRQVFVKINVFKKENMRSVVYKIVLGKQDLLLLFNKMYMSVEFDDQLPINFFDQLYEVICKLFVFEKEGIYKVPKIHLLSQRSSHMELTCKFPWLENYRYSDYSFQPYQPQSNFYNQVSKNPQVVCHIPTFIYLPINSKLPQSGQFQAFGNAPYIIFDEESPVPTACIFTITISKLLKSYFIHMYFAKNQRKFVAQISFSEMRVRKQNNAIDYWVDQRCGIQTRQQLYDILLNNQKGENIQQLWIAISRTFRIFINDHNKTLLQIPVFEITCIFQEVLYHEVRKLAKDNDEALFQIHIEQNKHQIPGQLDSLNKPLRQIRIMQSSYFNVYIKIQWLQHQEKMQSTKIPLTQILMGCYKKYGHIFSHKKQDDTSFQQESVYSYSFVHADLIKMAKIVCEMIILNWQSTKLDLSEMLPLDNLPKTKQPIKTNASVSLSMAFARQEYLLMYSGVLINKTQTIMSLFLRREKNQVCFYIQRLNDCQSCEKIVDFQQIENNLPGFRAQILGQKYDIGRRIFLLFKNRMILHTYYKLKD